MELIDAIQKDQTTTIKTIIENGFAINSFFKLGRERTTALAYAAHIGKTRAVKMLLSLGADVHIGNDTPLMLASRNGYFEIVEILLKNGADPHAQQGKAFMFATREKHYYVLGALKHHANYKPIANNCKLVQACQDGDISNARQCLLDGANIHVWNDMPLRHAIHKKQKKITAMLIQHANCQVSDDIHYRLKLKKWTDLLNNPFQSQMSEQYAKLKQ